MDLMGQHGQYIPAIQIVQKDVRIGIKKRTMNVPSGLGTRSQHGCHNVLCWKYLTYRLHILVRELWLLNCWLLRPYPEDALVVALMSLNGLFCPSWSSYIIGLNWTLSWVKWHQKYWTLWMENTRFFSTETSRLEAFHQQFPANKCCWHLN